MPETDIPNYYGNMPTKQEGNAATATAESSDANADRKTDIAQQIELSVTLEQADARRRFRKISK